MQAVALLGAGMTFQEFAQLHIPALEADEIRFNLQIAVIAAAATEFPSGFLYWTLGAPGHCATQSPLRPLLLGDLDRAECQHLARETKDLPYPGVIGSGSTARWFTEEASAAGIAFPEVEPQRIHVLREPPRYPGAEGSPRGAVHADADLILEWIRAFQREAVPHEPPFERAKVEKGIALGRYLLWTVGGEPVSLAGLGRTLKSAGSIAPVYTPPDKRARGYAGSVTAALCERIFADGKPAACLYTDLRNPYSNRCYAKIGFKPHCDSWHYLRQTQAFAEA
jgi:hypothetical protein